MQKYRFLLCYFILTVFTLPLFGQQTLTFDSNSSQILSEFNAIIVEAEGKLRVEFIMGRPEQATSGQEEKLKKGDYVLMMNASRLATITDIREQYDRIAIGDEIKIGVRRGEQRFILSKIKGDVPEQSSRRLRMNMDMDLGDDVESVVVAELGLIIFDKDEHIEIAETLPPLLPEVLKDSPLKGYHLSTINGQTFENAEALKTYLAELEVGATMELYFNKKGVELTASVVKQKTRSAVNFNIKN